MLDKLCVSISNSNSDKVLELAQKYPFVEIRQDLCRLNVNTLEAISKINSTKIFTIKDPDPIIQKEQIEIALNCDFDLIDLDLKLIEPSIIVDNSSISKDKFLYSFHADKNEKLLVDPLISKLPKAKFLKIASFNSLDIKNFSNENHIIKVPMGIDNQNYRYDILLEGQEFTYVYPDDEINTAEGQFSFTEAMKYFKDIEKYAVFGSPISHSQSPQIFKNYHYANDHYSRIKSKTIEELVKFVETFELNGFNVTSPLKSEVASIFEKFDENISSLKNANTIFYSENKYLAANTDLAGFKEAFKPFVDCNNILIIGAGSTVRTLLFELELEHRVTICNRSKGRLIELKNDYDFEELDWEDLDKSVGEFDLIISTIPKEVFPKADLYVEYKDGNEFALTWLRKQADIAFIKYFNLKSKRLQPKLDTKRGIALIGFMGSGKTSLGKYLSEQMGFQFFDLDEIIEKSQNKSIFEIFEEDGESSFRQLEKQELFEFEFENSKLLSLGGGIVEDLSNKLKLKDTFVIFVHSDFEDIWLRIKNSDRPLLKLGKESLKELYYKRLNKYFYFSDLILINDTYNSVKEDLIEEISNAGFDPRID